MFDRVSMLIIKIEDSEIKFLNMEIQQSSVNLLRGHPNAARVAVERPAETFSPALCTKGECCRSTPYSLTYRTASIIDGGSAGLRAAVA